MARRTYAQYCPAARALDVIGERWTILLVRELLLGPKRYTDLLEGLPGIAPNVLAPRLKHLQESGIVQRTSLPPPAASTVYELTELGHALRPLLQELTSWGLNFLGNPRPGDELRLGWLLATLEGSFHPEAARDVRETYEFRVDGDVFHVRVDDGDVDVCHGAAEDPACVVTADLATFLAVGSRQLTPDEAIAQGLMGFEGDREAGERSIEILGPHFGIPGPPGGVWGAVQARVRLEATSGVREAYEFRIDGEVFHLSVDDGAAEVRPGAAPDPAFVLTADLGTFLSLGAGQLPLDEAVASGEIRVDGDVHAGRRLMAICDLVPAPAT